MDTRLVVPLVVGGVALLLVGFTTGALDPLLTTDGYDPSTFPGSATPTDGNGTGTPLSYEHTTVTVLDAETNETLGAVRVAIADTWRKKYTGLSKTETLPADRGMLFTYEEEGNHTYVMREMDFGIDIVYVGEDGRITSIHHAPEPPEGEDGESYQYPGRGQYVLEVTYEWTTRHDVSEGDRVVIEGYET